jgi:hypothetical protein
MKSINDREIRRCPANLYYNKFLSITSRHNFATSQFHAAAFNSCFS